jgi:mono/diheme cytochrome c family protein
MPMTYPACLPATLIAAVLAVPVYNRADDPPKPAAQVTVDFDRDVKPIFAKHCIACHGSEKQKQGLRLDRKNDALKGGDSGVAVVPGKSAESLLFQLVSGQDKDRQMPPKGELAATEISTLKAWIDQGAKWADDGSTAINPTDWWSLKPLVKPAVPNTPSTTHNAIDQFILAKLRDKGLSPSAEADRRTLIRRVYFDLTGLPPTPDAVESFAKDNAPDAYEKLIDTLLASPRYGERWARHWLDVVHFGETHGYDKDQPRPNAWPYRDYVIRAFNTDKPYSRFVQEQVAGDVLFPGTVDGIEALGFLAAGPWDFIGHVEVPETKIDGKVARHLDRDDFVANTIGTFMGLTVHCAQCHNHKFDPIAQEDYYRLQAVFAAIDRTDKTYDADPKITARRAELETQKRAAGTKVAAIQAEARKNAGPEFVLLEKQITEASQPANLPKPPEYGYHSALSAKQDNTKWVQVDLGVSVKLDRIVLRPCHDEFNNIGAGFGFPVRFKVEVSDDVAFKNGVTIIADNTARDFANPGTAPVTALANGRPARYVRVTATKLAPRQNDHMLALAELEALDAEGKNWAAKAAVSALDSIEAPSRWRKSNLTDGLYPPGPKLAVEELTKLTERRDTLLKAALGETGAADLAATQATLQMIDAELGKLAGMRKVAYIGTIHTSGGAFSGTGPFGGKPRPIYILPRGDVTKPGKEVGPGAIAAIPGIKGSFELPANHTEGDRRAALARWLTDTNNPLTWRVMANRVWQYHFGRGLVDTPNDFGKMGQLPTHPELLDWLAAELSEHQSIKKLHKLILMSATYRQTSNTEPDIRNRQSKIRLFGIAIPTSAFRDSRATVDGDNRYLWRQNRRKLEAEAVRDSILFVAGKLDLTMGGPSFQDFVIEKPEHSPHYEYQLFDPENPKGHRRAVYRFIVRSKQQPFLAALDCADPSLAVDKRNETLTPQQALTLLNNTLAVAMARHFALRVEKLATDNEGRVRAAFRLALGREPTAQERDALVGYVKDYGLANGCRVILNLNEFVFVD